MMTGTEERLAAARTLLDDGVVAQAHLLPHDIRESWQRCLAAGLDPRRPPPTPTVGAAELARARERHGRVRHLALAEIQNLYHQISGSNFLIALGDPDGLLLDTLADDSFRDLAEARAIRGGSLWAERVQGTNALGLAAACQRPVIVHGREHFFATHGALTCAAAPIFDPEGRVAAVLDASSDCTSRQQHTMALVRMAALTIENGLFRTLHDRQLILVFHNRAEFLRTPQAGLIALDGDGRLAGLNRPAAFLLQGLPAGPGCRLEDLFACRFATLVEQAHRTDMLFLEDHVGSRYAASLENLGRACPLHGLHPVPAPLPARSGATPVFIADDLAVARALEQVKGAVRLGVPLLVRGPTGSGKELMARQAHAVSGRRGAFVPINCAALPDSLVEAELFGYADGAFTGARRGGAKGLVLEADKGTLFLDEIGDMPLALQAVLLRLLDDWTVRPVGGRDKRVVDVQLVAATNVDLAAAVAAGRFRADLWYRLNAVEVLIPPLAARSDLAALARHLLGKLDPAGRLTADGLERLARHAWPGNVRELRNVLTRLVILAAGRPIEGGLVAAVLPPAPAAPVAADPPATLPPAHLRETVAGCLRQVWDETGGNVSETARRLGISRNTVYRKLRGLGLCQDGPAGLKG